MIYIKILSGMTVKFNQQEFKGDQVYEVTVNVANRLIAEGWAVQVEKPESETAQ